MYVRYCAHIALNTVYKYFFPAGFSYGQTRTENQVWPISLCLGSLITLQTLTPIIQL